MTFLLQVNFGIFFITTILLQCCIPFNIDTFYPIVKRGLRGSYFGYSIAQHTIAGSKGMNRYHVLLVGAPRQRTGNNSVTGSLFKCPPSSPRHDDCTPVHIDLKSKKEEMEDQWMGASVASQHLDGGKAVVCAPRYKDYEEASVHGQGLCVSLTNRLKKEDFLEPCLGRSVEKAAEEYGFCQAGFGLDIAEDGEVMVGAPGAISWSGMAFVKRSSASINDDDDWKHSLAESVAVGRKTFHPPTRYYSYLGMSAKFGNVNQGRTYVVGAPRSRGAGQVFLMRRVGNDLVVERDGTLSGGVFGGYFGHEVAVVDLNLDGMDDVVVGAPFEHHKGRGGGAVYIYFNTINGINSRTVARRIVNREMGEKECLRVGCIDARFGFSLANLGDLDGDGYPDLAIGAPYEGSGAVYIYHGCKDGIEENFSQRISGREVRPGIQAFGHSLSAGLDLDSNGDPDLSVGAYASDAVIILRTRSVVKGGVTMQTRPFSIDPSSEDCSNSTRACFHLKTCFRLKINPRNNLKGDLFIHYKIETDAIKDTTIPRVRFNNPKGLPSSQNKLFKMGKTGRCIDQKIFLNPINRDFYNPVVFKLSFGLSDRDGVKLTSHQHPHPFHYRRKKSPLPPINQLPILNRGFINKTHLMHFKKKCVNGIQCVSNLKLSAIISKADKTAAGEYVVTVGGIKEITLQVEVQNNEEEAHEAQLFVLLPPSIKHHGTDERGKQYSCSYDDNLISCNLGNPMPGNHVVTFGVRLDVSMLDSTSNDTTISLFVNTTSIEDETSDDKLELSLKVIVEAEMEVRGLSTPSEVYFGENRKDKDIEAIKRGLKRQMEVLKEEEIGPIVKHNYEVKNLKGGGVRESFLEVDWPVKLQATIDNKNVNESKELLYLLDLHTDANMKCELLNPNYPLNYRKISRTPKNVTSADQSMEGAKRRSRRSSTTSAIEKFFRDRFSNTPTKLACGMEGVMCVTYRCVIGELLEGQSSVATFVARLWENTFLEAFMGVDKLKLFSKARIHIDKKWSIYQTNTKNDISETFTAVLPAQDLARPQSIDLWMVVLALCLGLLSLLLLVFLLWKCGFFNRSKATDPPFHQARLVNQPKSL